MANSKSHWLRDLLWIPLVVGIVIAIITFALPRIFKDDLELSYTIQDPITYLDMASIGGKPIEVEGVETSRLIVHQAKIWNSGDLPIKKLPVSYIFEPTQKKFVILSVARTTKPEREFGEITPDKPQPTSRRFVYELLNVEDEVNTSFLTNAPGKMKIFAKTEGLKLKKVSVISESQWARYTQYGAVFLGLIASFATMAMRTAAEVRLGPIRVLFGKKPKG